MDHIFINDKVLSIEEIRKLPNTLKLWYKSICTICGNEFQTRCKNKTSTCSRCKNSIAAKKMYEDNPNLAAERLKKRTETNLKKYGVKNVYQAESIKEKIKQTNFRKYGVENYAKTNECKEKTKSTCLKKYGVEHSFQSENNKIKSKETSLKKYGVESPMQSENVKKKVEETKLKKYGDMHFVKIITDCTKYLNYVNSTYSPNYLNRFLRG